MKTVKNMENFEKKIAFNCNNLSHVLERVNQKSSHSLCCMINMWWKPYIGTDEVIFRQKVSFSYKKMFFDIVLILFFLYYYYYINHLLSIFIKYFSKYRKKIIKTCLKITPKIGIIHRSAWIHKHWISMLHESQIWLF